MSGRVVLHPAGGEGRSDAGLGPVAGFSPAQQIKMSIASAHSFALAGFLFTSFASLHEGSAVGDTLFKKR